MLAAGKYCGHVWKPLAVTPLCSFRQSSSLRRNFHDMHEPLEEQTVLRYGEKRYYPVRIGRIFKERYRVIAKLGYGAYSTVWLTEDVESVHPFYAPQLLLPQYIKYITDSKLDRKSIQL